MIASSIELCLFAVESNGFWFWCLWWIFHICTECIDNFAPNVFVHLFSEQYHPILSYNQCYVIGHPLFCFGVLKQRTPESLWQCCSNLRKKTLLPKQINLPPNWPSCSKLCKNPLRLGQWYPLEDIEIFYKNSQAITCKAQDRKGSQSPNPKYSSKDLWSKYSKYSVVRLGGRFWIGEAASRGGGKACWKVPCAG